MGPMIEATSQATPPSGGGGPWRLEVTRTSYHKYCPGDAWEPELNFYEDDTSFYMVVNLAGVGAQAVELEARDGQLIVSGSRATPPPPEVHGKIRLLHMEIDHGPFRRAVRIPDGVDVDAISAIYRTGQLLVTLPKA